MVFVELKGKLACQGTQGSRNPEEKARGEQRAKKLHLPNANYSSGTSLTMDCWDCQIKPHLATLSAWHPSEEDTSLKAWAMILSSYILSLPHCCPPGGQETKLITHLVIDVTVDGAFP